jgi:hypothetical protein
MGNKTVDPSTRRLQRSKVARSEWCTSNLGQEAHTGVLVPTENGRTPREGPIIPGYGGCVGRWARVGPPPSITGNKCGGGTTCLAFFKNGPEEGRDHWWNDSAISSVNAPERVPFLLDVSRAALPPPRRGRRHYRPNSVPVAVLSAALRGAGHCRHCRGKPTFHHTA